MTTKEFSNQFDIHYNSIATNDSPDIDLYEKSVYLTKAQLEVIKNTFVPEGNKYRKGFEESSKRRTDLKNLVKSYKRPNPVISTEGLSPDSRFFEIPENTFLIIYESLKVLTSCPNNEFVKVIPIIHDDYNTLVNNPFKSPNKKLAWRLDLNTKNVNTVEIISPLTIIYYYMRYIEYPEPIILTDLKEWSPSENLTIDGKHKEQTCKLNQIVHEEILDRAVQLAKLDYDPEDVQLRTQINLRNE